jgi:hypothetical protein
MDMLVCQIVYYVVLDSKDFNVVSGRKEGGRSKKGSAGVPAAPHG